MKLSTNPDGGWQAVAVFEVESDAAVAVDAFVVQFDDDVDRTSTCKLVRAADAPAIAGSKRGSTSVPGNGARSAALRR